MTSYSAPLGLCAAPQGSGTSRPREAVPADAAGREATRRGLALVRAYAREEPAAVDAALAGADRVVARQLPSVTGDILRLVVGIVTSAPRGPIPADVARTAATLAAAGPPHHEFAVTEAVRAWAAGDGTPARTWWQGGVSGAHGTAVLAAALAVRAWGRAPFLGLLETFDGLLDASASGEAGLSGG
ncbi:hypothetical protein [Streptomyces silvensis]|uniref:Uncharacterized protein n=1 Tax=Streptomyces silvensis TaxID=1765722 RepID=A0A0W7X806_9ACTN|nr:hypothetical protein [Streptomyces silvensis]KUF19007.1 hypothetical protein AT728_08370 [Streptomyces silvensis]